MGLGCLGFGVLGFLWLAGNDGMEKKVRTTIMCYIGTNLRIHSSSPSLPKVSTTHKSHQKLPMSYPFLDFLSTAGNNQQVVLLTA